MGASGLNYGFLSFLFVMGLLRKDNRSLALSFLILFLYSGLIAGLFPGDPRISWESHIAGAISGILFAVLLYKRDPFPEDPFKDEELEEIEDYDEEGNLIIRQENFRP